MSIEKDFYDYLDTNSSLTKETDLFLYEAPENTETPYAVVLNAGRTNTREHIGTTKEYQVSLQVNLYYSREQRYSMDTLSDEIDALFTDKSMEIGTNLIWDLVINSLPNIDETYYTYVKQFDFAYREA